jgi:hypothetical protein
MDFAGTCWVFLSNCSLFFSGSDYNMLRVVLDMYRYVFVCWQERRKKGKKKKRKEGEMQWYGQRV